MARADRARPPALHALVPADRGAAPDPHAPVAGRLRGARRRGCRTALALAARARAGDRVGGRLRRADRGRVAARTSRIEGARSVERNARGFRPNDRARAGAWGLSVLWRGFLP